MAKMTLLSMVQDILNDMDSDDVNSVNDTEEALQVANIIKTTFYEVIGSRYWPHLRNIGQLSGSGDSSKPVHLLVPDDAQIVEWLKYNTRTATATRDSFVDITYKEPKEFMDYVNARNSSDSTVSEVIDYSGITLLVKNSTAPLYWTSFDDEVIVMDAYNSAVDSTLQGSKTQVQVYREPAFTIADAFIPDLTSKAFPYLLSEAKSVAFNALRQVGNQKEEQRSRRQRTWLAREKRRTNEGINRQNYGRKK